MGYAVRFIDDHYFPKNLNSKKGIAIPHRSEDRSCSSDRKVEHSSTDNNDNKSQQMRSLVFSVTRTEEQLESEFELDASCFDLYPTIADVRPLPESLQIRWATLWSRVTLNLKRAIKESNCAN